MQCLEVSGAVRLIYKSLGVKGLRLYFLIYKSSERKTSNTNYVCHFWERMLKKTVHEKFYQSVIIWMLIYRPKTLNASWLC